LFKVPPRLIVLDQLWKTDKRKEIVLVVSTQHGCIVEQASVRFEKEQVAGWVVFKQQIKWFDALNVDIHIGTTIMMKDKVTNGINSVYGALECHVVGNEPSVMIFQELHA
jgi:hypothetical protein